MIHHKMRSAFGAIVVATLVLNTVEGTIQNWFGRASGCSLAYSTDFPDKESVLLRYTTDGYELLEPTESAVNLAAQEEVFVYCPGSRNSITALGLNIASAKCVAGQTLSVQRSEYLLNELGCGTSVTGEVQVSSSECGTRGVIKQLGHKIDGEILPLIDVCYDDDKGEGVYAEHMLYGSAIDYSKPGNTRPSFKVGGVATGVSPDNAYKQATQKTTFTTLLGSSALADKYIYSNSYLARGHLSPDGDFVYVTSKYTSYFYINTVPQWQAVNNGNWKSLEFSVRNAASSTSDNFRVITGGHEVLALDDVNGNPVEIYLATNSRLPVPKFVWKIAYSYETNQAIAFVSLNNPFVAKVTADHYICKDICSENGWGSNAWLNASKGLIYCCDVNELKQVVTTIPEVDYEGILQGPNATGFWAKYFSGWFS